jgi:ribosomal protein S18 acetylase RimI-like enzyme
MTWSAAEIVALERISARAWPAAREASIGGWRLHASSGFSGRINACWPLSDTGLEPAESVAAVEDWYETSGLPCLFKLVGRACWPADLAVRLQARGYQVRTETLMMVGAAGGRADPRVRLGETVDETFASVFAATAADPGDAAERLATLGRIPMPRVFARLDLAGSPAAIGACAVEGSWAGVFAMRTDPSHRRQGLARRILAALLASAGAAGAKRAWLQVEAANAGAIELYRASGFEEAYRYAYWSKA